ncbi:hypothetical protein EDD16DRAFT_1599235 [Pisolithus croceorrhizus]|nr:hypothetical protein EDD16DRAFT_1599235 [Pisolithus croceorrhizus]
MSKAVCQQLTSNTGQSYVALSRAASMDGLQVLRFDPKKVMAHPKVIEWCKTLEVVETDKQNPSDQRPTSGSR